MSKANLDNLSDSADIFNDLSLKKVFKEGIKSLNVGKIITDFITKKYQHVPLNLKNAASATLNIAIYTAGVAAGVASLLIFIHATWPVITAIALAGVAATALAIAITCISIACHKANKEDNGNDTSSKKTSNDNDHPDNTTNNDPSGNTPSAPVSNHDESSASHSSHDESFTKSNSEPSLFTINSDNGFPIGPSIGDSQQVYTRYFSLIQQAHSDRQVREHAEKAKQNLEKIKTSLQNEDSIDTDAINKAIETLSQNTICLLSITSIPMKEIEVSMQRSIISNTKSSNGQAELFNAEQITPPAYLNDICSEDRSTIQNGIKAALGLNEISQEENGKSQDIQTILANIEKVEQQIDAVVKDIKQKQSTLQNLQQNIDLSLNQFFDD